jgi:hypothetical protein
MPIIKHPFGALDVVQLTASAGHQVININKTRTIIDGTDPIQLKPRSIALLIDDTLPAYSTIELMSIASATVAGSCIITFSTGFAEIATMGAATAELFQRYFGAKFCYLPTTKKFVPMGTYYREANK